MEKKSYLLAAIIAAGALALTACGGSEAPSTELETAQQLATANAYYNAFYGPTGVSLQSSGYTIDVLGDPAVTESCLQGSGWANVNFVKGSTVTAYACPTAAAGDCVIETQPHTTTCNSKLTYPAPTLTPVITGH